MKLVYRPDHPEASRFGFVSAEKCALTDVGHGRVPVFTDLYMDGAVATDGTDIGSRAKRRAYMQVNNLADFDDFKGTWERADKERREGSPQSYRELREAVGRAAYEAGRRHGR